MIKFFDLASQQEVIKKDLDVSLSNVLRNNQFINGPEVAQLERMLATVCNVKDVITCANGTDAISLALMSLDLKVGDAVIVPSFTYVASAEAVAQLGMVPYFVDVEQSTFNICLKSVEAAVSEIKKSSLNLGAIIGVDLFGRPCDAQKLKIIADESRCKLIIDSAQSFGASINDVKVGNFGHVTTTSFFPAKPLGCYGDGGAVFTNDLTLGASIRCKKSHGSGAHKYEHVDIGINSRLDTIQACILLEKLKVFEKECKRRDEIARLYNRELKDFVGVPIIDEDATSVWAQYTVKCHERDSMKAALSKAGVPSVVYYPTPLHKQPAYQQFPRINPALCVSEKLSKEVLSLPIHSYLTEAEIETVVSSVKSFYQ
jgi:dTDP-4-amino-4,6-dideoxygalactose transaminase